MNINTRHKILRYLEIYILYCNKPEYTNNPDYVFDVARDDAVFARNWLLEHKDIKTLKQIRDAAPHNIYLDIYNSLVVYEGCIVQDIDDTAEISNILDEEDEYI